MPPAGFRHLGRLGALFGRTSADGNSSLSHKLAVGSRVTCSSHSEGKFVANTAVKCFSTTSSVSGNVLDISGIFPPIPTPFISSHDDDGVANAGKLTIDIIIPFPKVIIVNSRRGVFQSF